MAINLPSISEVVNHLCDVREDARDMRSDGCDPDYVDVRLCVESDGAWMVRSGDVSFDPYHSTYCGAASVGPDDSDESLTDTAADLLGQVEDAIAMDAADI